MSAIDEVAVLTSFNEAINAQDLDRLDELTTEAHRFVDSAGATIDGRVACLDAWRGFFAAFPDYRNVFEECRCLGDGLVFVRGRSYAASLNLMGRPSGASSFETSTNRMSSPDQRRRWKPRSDQNAHADDIDGRRPMGLAE